MGREGEMARTNKLAQLPQARKRKLIRNASSIRGGCPCFEPVVPYPLYPPE